MTNLRTNGIGVSAALALLLSVAFPGHAQTNGDWPQWRGPHRNGVSDDTGLLKQWPAGGPELLWKATGTGEGYATPAVAGGRVFAMGDRDDAVCVIARDASTGAQAWKTKIGKPGKAGDKANTYAGPRCTPAVDGDRLYALGQHGELACLKTGDGEVVWKKDLDTDFRAGVPYWGYSESPLVDGDRVLAMPGSQRSSLVAFNKNTGAVIWQRKDIPEDPPVKLNPWDSSYTSVIAVEIGGVRQYVQFVVPWVAGVAASSGEVLWKSRHSYNLIISSPVYADNMVLVSMGYGTGHSAYRIASRDGVFSAELAYSGKEMSNQHGGMVLAGRHLYGFSDSTNAWVCLEFPSGKVAWQDKGVGKGSIACADGRFYLHAEGGKGAVALVEATPEGYREKGRFDPPGQSDKSHVTHPVISGGRLFLRDQDLLLCYRLRAP